eukprot:TRINITY_DN9781_c0_g1_i1.p1 TRINITY_DN9781_c0_g1~~TRINITY_DN9781_c0_g1_i1.p1  ORF type:complete len:73 (+),score=17.80 TRINITY_DN9781_c0_g1_i1:180-398(+)
MTQLLTADRTKRSMITESEGEAQALINKTTATREAKILAAQDEKQSAILKAEARKTKTSTYESPKGKDPKDY